MANVRWIGGAPTVAQVRKGTITGYDVTTTYTVTISNKTVSTIGTGGTSSTTATALVALLFASTEPEFAEWTWAANGSAGDVQGTMKTPGKPGTFTLTVSGGSGTRTAAADVTANSGPNDVGIAANYDGNALPVATNNFFIDSTDVSLLYNLGALSAVALTSITVGSSFTGTIGLPKQNTDGTAYPEYRPDYFQVQASTVNIGVGDGQGSGRIKIDNGSGTAATVNVYSTASGADTDLEAFLWKGTNAGNVLNVIGGTAGVAAFPGETATVATLGIVGGTVRVTSGVTLTTVNQTGGTLTAICAATTINASEGAATTLLGTAAYTTITLDSGASLVYQSSGTITTLKLGASSSVDFSQDSRGKTVTNLVQLYAGSTFNDPGGVVTMSAGFQTVRCSLGDVSVVLAPNRSYT